jgi:abortive infection bacteriophage resistance protein
MEVPSIDEANTAMMTIGYYRLRGYCFQWYDNATKQYQAGTNFQNVLKLYQFDTELSHLLFSMASSIEVALRVRLTEALLIYNDALILMDPAVFDDKERYWKNLSVLSGEIARSNDVFIRHNYEKHEGKIPLWAAVEVMSFGTLSKTIKNLATGSGSAYSGLAQEYLYTTIKGQKAAPSKKMLSSWVQAISVLRNMCAHNSRIYNRSISTTPELLVADQVNPKPRYNGLYQIILAMKYLRPNNEVWNQFTADLKSLFAKYDGIFEHSRINFPSDWENHLVV